MSIDRPVHTPPLGYAALTPLYDSVIALMTREKNWRGDLIEMISPKVGDVILDVGSGTGSLAVSIHRAEPSVIYLGIDPDEEAITRARRKTAKAGSSAEFLHGFLTLDAISAHRRPNKAVSSLVLHQVSLDEKQRILTQMYESVVPGGWIFIADYGEQRSKAMRFAFRHTVQSLDGTEDTQPNADGVLPSLMQQAGLAEVAESARINTITGTICLYIGRKL